MITQAEKIRRQRAYDYAIASCELENCIITNDVKNLYHLYVNGELSLDEVSTEIDKNLSLKQCNNIVGQDKLVQEGLFVSKRLFQLQEKPIKGKYDLAHLCKINEYLFQDLPKLGGDYAKIYKPGQYRPAILPWKMWIKHRPLLNCSDVSTIVYSNMDAGIIKETNNYLLKNVAIIKLKKMRINNFVNKISELYTKLDYLHPFYDGNSRTIREFTRTLALEAGFNMNWQNSNIDEQSANELYIARDTAVNKIAHERMLIPEGKYDIEIYMKPFKGKKTLTEILSANVARV